MQHRILALVFLALLVAPVASRAQEEESAESGSDLLRSRIIEAMRLPGVTQDAREAGVPEEDIRTIIDIGRKRDLPPEETREILEETATSVREQGPIDNFGAFVQARLDEGLRGRDLAAAIHAEHAARGIGKGMHRKGGKAMKEHRGKPGDRDVYDDRDEPELHQESDDHAGTAEHGKSGDHGQAKDKGKNKGKNKNRGGSH